MLPHLLRAPARPLLALLALHAAASACTYVARTKLNNSNFVDGDGPRQADSAAECAGLCASTPACTFFGYQDDPAVNGTQCRWATLTHCCWLHTSNASAGPDDTFTSGEIFDGSPCPPPLQPCVDASENECGASDREKPSTWCCMAPSRAASTSASL